MCEDSKKTMIFLEDFTKTMEVLIWKAIAINERQGLKNHLVKKNTFKLDFQQCNDEITMMNLSRQLIVGGDSTMMILRGGSDWLMMSLEFNFSQSLFFLHAEERQGNTTILVAKVLATLVKVIFLY